MSERRLFCELEFLKDFYNHLPDPYSMEEIEIQKRELWVNFRNLILRSDISLNVSIQELDKNKDCNDLIKYIIKNWAAGICDLKCEDEDYISSNDLSNSFKKEEVYRGAYFLINNLDKEKKKVMNRYGLIAFDNNTIYKKENMFREHCQWIQKGEMHLSFWKFLNEFRHPCNSLSIYDNYILQHDYSIKKNIIPILKYLLPERLNIPFHISIFSYTSPNFKTINFQDRYESIKDEIKHIRPDLDFKLSVFKTNKEEHDRFVITNYMSMVSGAGFDTTSNSNKTKHSTLILINFPQTSLFHSKNSDNILSVVKNFEKSIFNNATKNGEFQNYWGEKENRLFDV